MLLRAAAVALRFARVSELGVVEERESRWQPWQCLCLWGSAVLVASYSRLHLEYPEKQKKRWKR